RYLLPLALRSCAHSVHRWKIRTDGTRSINIWNLSRKYWIRALRGMTGQVRLPENFPACVTIVCFRHWHGFSVWYNDAVQSAGDVSTLYHEEGVLARRRRGIIVVYQVCRLTRPCDEGDCPLCTVVTPMRKRSATKA